MANKIPCEVIQDLFPSYIDGLTSDITNSAVKEHIAECSHCKNVLEAMREPTEMVGSEDKREIDFLKRTRRKTQGIMAGSILAAVLTVIIILIARLFFVGNYIYEEAIACEVQVDGKHLTLDGVTTDDGLGISAVEYAEKEGVVTVSFKAVRKSPFYKGDFQSEYTSANEITQVCLGNRIIWAQGESISAMASAVFNSRHPYIGDMSQNGQTVRALNMTSYLGNFTNELQTVKEPYGWKMILEKEIDASQQKDKEQRMKSYAYIFLAVIDNLGEVSFAYEVDGRRHLVTVTQEEASTVAGQDIKKCGKNILSLQKLIKKTLY